jgi:iron complex outermembrane receptor protein
VDGSFDVYEGFGELIVPLVSDRAFFHSLSLEAGIRRSHYTVDAPGTPKFNTTTWKVGAQWEPVVGVKLRGSYNRAVRAPNIGELFFPVTTGLTNLGSDPCAGTNITGVLRDVCIFQGAPPSTIGTISDPTAGQAQSTSGGNPNLKPEKATSWTIGAVLQPTDFIRGLTITVDYYNIKIDEASGTPTPGDIISACFDAPSVTNPACAQIVRNPITGGLDGDPATTPGLLANLTNLGTLDTDGVDLGINYRTNLPFAGARLNWSFNGNYTHNSRFNANPLVAGSLNRECTGFYSPNCGSIQPKFQFQQRTTLSFGSVDVSLLWRYIHGVDFEHQQQLDDEAAADDANRDQNGVLLPVALQGCPDYAGADPGGCVVDPRFRSINAKHYFDLSTRIGVTDNFDFTLTVQNLFNKTPPIVGGTVGSTTYNGGNTYPSTYDPLGRRFAVGARLKF